MSSIFSTQKRQSFLRRKYCFLVMTALSPPVGRMDPLIGLPPFCSAMLALLLHGFRLGCCYRRRYFGHRCTGHRGCRAGRGVCRLCRQSGCWSHNRRLAVSTLFTLLLPLFNPLHLLVDTHGDKLHHTVVDARTALHFLQGGCDGGELDEDVVALSAFLNAVGQLADTPLLPLIYCSATLCDGCLDLFDDGIDLFIGEVGANY